jgi:hypothetical protein
MMRTFTDIQERVERSDVGRMAISAFLVFTLFGIVIWNLPGSVLRERLVPVARPYFDMAGLDQGWGVFAPDPRQMTNDVFAVLDYPDGSETVWRAPLGNPEVATYRTYRWQKWTEHVSIDETWLGGPAVHWLASTQKHKGMLPWRVMLIQRYADTPPPGPAQSLKWHEHVLDTWTSPSIPRFGL